MGQTISGAGLRGIPGVYVIALDPAGKIENRQEPVPYSSVLQDGDFLWISVDLSAISYLSKLPGITFVQNCQVCSKLRLVWT